VIQIKALKKTYKMGKSNIVYALRGVDLFIASGEFVAIMGPSGSGKSTLMNIIGCLDRPTEGTYELAAEEISKKSDNELAAIRNKRIGFVFQTFNLLPRLSAQANVELPLVYRGMSSSARRAAADEALEAVGLAERKKHKPQELSGGQQQRVAIARALASNPSIILADEPTGNLDSRSGTEVMQVFQKLNDAGITLIVVTHDDEIAQHAKRIVRLRDGLVVSDEAVTERLLAGTTIDSSPQVEGFAL